MSLIAIELKGLAAPGKPIRIRIIVMDLIHVALTGQDEMKPVNPVLTGQTGSFFRLDRLNRGFGLFSIRLASPS